MATLTLRPNAAGSETSITSQTPDSTYHWDKVDEETADAYTTRVYTLSASYLRDLYALPNHTTESGVINFVKIYFCCVTSNATYGVAKPSLKSDSTVTDGTQVALTTTWTTFSQQWNVNPATGLAWGSDWSVIDALQIGASLHGNGESVWSYLTQVYVEVDYTPVKGRSFGFLIG